MVFCSILTFVNESCRFAIITDTLFTPTDTGEVRGVVPYPRAIDTVKATNELTTPLAFIVHTDEFAADPDESTHAVAYDALVSDSQIMVKQYWPGNPID